MANTPRSQCRGPGSIPGQGNRFRMPQLKTPAWGFPGAVVVKNPPAKAGNTGSSPGPGRSHMLRSN